MSLTRDNIIYMNSTRQPFIVKKTQLKLEKIYLRKTCSKQIKQRFSVNVNAKDKSVMNHVQRPSCRQENWETGSDFYKFITDNKIQSGNQVKEQHKQVRMPKLPADQNGGMST